MFKFYIISVILIILSILIEILNKKDIKENNTNNTTKDYLILKNPMTETELKFCLNLKEITDKYNLIIIPQLQLQKIFKTYDKNNIKAFNKIKSKSIDFAIVDSNYNYKMFIELDDYTHNKKNRQERDIFINDLFSKYNLKLKRIKVQNNYNLEQLEKITKEVI